MSMILFLFSYVFYLCSSQTQALCKLSAIWNISFPPCYNTPWNCVDLSETQLCTKCEISCDAHHNILYLKVDDENISRHIPRELGELLYLRELNLMSSLVGTLPSEIGNLVHLTQLILIGGQTGTIPNELGRLISLNSLVLKGDFTGTLPSSLSSLAALTHLDVNVRDHGLNEAVRGYHLSRGLPLPSISFTTTQQFLPLIMKNHLNQYNSDLQSRISKRDLFATTSTPTTTLGGMCRCPQGMYGYNCSLSCTCTPLQGRCDDGINGTGTCTCFLGFYGPNCSGICQCVTGICRDGSGGDGSCTCHPHYYGPKCTKRCGCSDHSLCDDGSNGTGECTCFSGYYGQNCTGICTCVGMKDDESGGLGNFSSVCDDGVNGTGACTCLPGFYGKNCDGVCDCVAGQGVCRDGSDANGTCECFPGFFGKNCNKKCRSCTGGSGGGQFFSNATCSGGDDTVCYPCTTSCPSGKYMSSACTGTADAICKDCKTPCNSSEIEMQGWKQWYQRRVLFFFFFFFFFFLIYLDVF
eukprot:TRINITY_DN8288_c0_g1_i2.p3 TRINITY_DN8288_c0_g1~~TRINITY_DN8288_c0_g1_i2.p3  ORF type:complete len:524 (-),score=81.57 TRINITY_DN8288_c0_g1_i2:3443-5014(-)